MLKSCFHNLNTGSLIDYSLKQKRLSILDVGCGSRSNQIVRFSLNVKRYDGVDNQYWNNDLESYKSIDNFFKIDLEKDSLKKIENNLYDVILLSHVIEHLDNGEEVIRSLIKKLNVGGVIYIETPSQKLWIYLVEQDFQISMMIQPIRGFISMNK